MNAELIEQLREYVGNPGYSHLDYADCMKEAADRIADLERQNAELVRQLAEAKKNAERYQWLRDRLGTCAISDSLQDAIDAADEVRIEAEIDAAMQAGKAGALKRCAANRDGECGHTQCPQLRDGEPGKTGRHCPLDTDEDDE